MLSSSRLLAGVLPASGSPFGATGTALAARALATKASADFQTKPYKLHRWEQSPPTNVTCTREEALHFYRQMATVRRLEAAANALYKEKAIRGFCHLYTGQEAVCVGMEAAIE